MNKRKLDDSNAKRLESLRKQAEEFKQKKSQIRSDLSNPEGVKNKKIVFDENDEEYKEEKQKMIHLLDDESGDEEEKNTDDENEESEKQTETNHKIQAKVQIESNLKELFCSNDVFKFKFSNLNEKTLESSASSSDEDDDDVKSEKDSLFDQPIVQKKTEKLVEPKEQKLVTTKLKTEVTSFLPDFATDDQIKDALVYFCSTRTDEELREDWTSKREILVEEYKKKHKRMIRIKKHKENEKLFSWKIKRTSSKQ